MLDKMWEAPTDEEVEEEEYEAYIKENEYFEQGRSVTCGY